MVDCLNMLLACFRKRMSEQGELHRHFGANMKRVAAAMAADSVHSQAAAVVLLEELERPLAFRDASKEKLEWCDRYFDMLVNDVKSKSHDGGDKNRGMCSISSRVRTGAAGCQKGSVTCFLKVPLASLGRMASAAQPNCLWNSQKTFNKTFYTTCRPRL